MAITRWHRGPNGVARPCTASVRACPYGYHFDSPEDAQSMRQRFPKGQEIKTLPFAHHFGVKSKETTIFPPDEISARIRNLSNRAREHYLTTGERIAPLGQITVDFGNNHRLIIRREYIEGDHRVASDAPYFTRYYLTYFYGEQAEDFTYEDVLFRRPNPDSMKTVQNFIQRSFQDSRDWRINHLNKERNSLGLPSQDPENVDPDFDKNLKQTYADTVQLIDQLEIISNGARTAYEKYDIDLFSKDIPGRLTLDVDFRKSALQPGDVVDALSVHAMHDTEVKEVSITVRESFNDGSGFWSITRIPEGNWYFAYKKDLGTWSRDITPNDAETVKTSMEKILAMVDKHRDSEQAVHFAHELVRDVENAITNYKLTVETRLATPQPTPQTEKSHSNPTPKPKKNVRDNLFGIFG
jgi:hypothetical protein